MFSWHSNGSSRLLALICMYQAKRKKQQFLNSKMGQVKETSTDRRHSFCLHLANFNTNVFSKSNPPNTLCHSSKTLSCKYCHKTIYYSSLPFPSMLPFNFQIPSHKKFPANMRYFKFRGCVGVLIYSARDLSPYRHKTSRGRLEHTKCQSNPEPCSRVGSKIQLELPETQYKDNASHGYEKDYFPCFWWQKIPRHLPDIWISIPRILQYSFLIWKVLTELRKSKALGQ